MSEEYVTLNIKPLGREERAAIVESVKRYMRGKGYSAELQEQRNLLRYEATIALVEAERDVWKAERKEAVEAGQAMVARVKKERDALIVKVSGLEAELNEKLIAEWNSTGLAR